jgi:hypothetical protein
MIIILLKANSLIKELLIIFFSYYYISSFVDPETVPAAAQAIHGAKEP